MARAAATTDRDRAAQRRRVVGIVATGADVEHERYWEDAVLEFPQLGERFEGVENFREWRRQYPADVKLEVRELRGEGELWVAEVEVSYDGSTPQPGIAIIELRDEKVARETVYVTERWEAPDWRRPWRAAP